MKKAIVGVAVAAAVVAAVAAVLILRDQGEEKTHAFEFKRATAVSSQTSNDAPPFAVNEWPQWRGPYRDGVSRDKGLLKEWPADGPPQLWTAKGLGNGMSSVAVAEGRILTLGRRGGDKVFLIALNVDTGEELWSTPIQSDDKPTATPTIDGDHVFAITYNGALVCAEIASGKVEWKKDLATDFGGSLPQWGFSESPLIDGDRVVCTPGAKDALMVALDKKTGKTQWTMTEPNELSGHGRGGAGYSSIVISHGAGVKQYVQLYGRGVIGVSAADGSLLWAYTRIANDVANIPTPIVHDDYVFAATGYQAGAALLRLEPTESGVKANEVYFRPGRKMQNHHGGMVLVGEHLYFGHGHSNGLPICVQLLTGEISWGPERGPGTGSAAVTCADGNLYFRYENGVMALIEATPKEYRLKASFQLPSHLAESWSHPVICGGRLYLRDQDVLMCYDLRDRSTASN